MAFQITLSTAATKTAYQRFGDAYISALSQAVPGLNMEQCQAILSDVIGTVGRKAPKEKKAAKAKKSPKSASPSKRDLKKVELIGELKSYGAFAGEIPAVADVSITDIRKQIAEAKKAKKADEKAKKAAKSPKKAKKAKSPKKAEPSKRDLKKAELAAEIAAKGGSLEKDATEYKIPELRQMLKALTPKKAKKAAAPKKVTPSKRDAKKVELAKEITAKGGNLEKDATEYSITELRNILKSVTPKKKKGRKAKKAAAAEADHESLLATLADSLKAAESKEETKAATKATTQWLDGECTIASVTQFTGGANGEVVTTTLHTAEPAAAATAEVTEADKIEFDSSDEEEDELDEESELSELSSDEDDDEADLSDSDDDE
jgi:hypothetical protein